MENGEILSIAIVAFIIIAVVSGVIGILQMSNAFDVNGYECCKNSYDNIKFFFQGSYKEYYSIIDHNSSFISGAENVFHVTYKVKHLSTNHETYVHGFIYHCDTDELYHNGRNIKYLDYEIIQS